MDNIKNDIYYIKRMIKDIQFLIRNTKGLKYEDLQSNEILCDSILFRLIQISENSGKISNEFKKKHTTIAWSSIKGMRNKIVHQYGDVDLEIIYDTVTKDIPEVFEIINDVL